MTYTAEEVRLALDNLQMPPSVRGMIEYLAMLLEQKERHGKHESWVAIKEGKEILAEDEFFAARPTADNSYNRKLFREGFDRGYRANDIQYPATVPNAKPIGSQLPPHMHTEAIGEYLKGKP